MIYLIPPFALIILLFFPWYTLSVLAAVIYGFRKLDHKEVFSLSAFILILVSLTSALFDLQSDGLVSERMAALFRLPLDWLFHLAVGLVPATLFLITAYVVSESRNLVKRRERKTEKRR